MVKKLIFLKAPITARVAKRQASVLKSKYPIYSTSGGIIKQVTIASTPAIQRTAFFLTKYEILCSISLMLCLSLSKILCSFIFIFSNRLYHSFFCGTIAKTAKNYAVKQAFMLNFQQLVYFH